MSNINNEILASIKEFEDAEYGDFICKLSPGLERNHVIGVRMPMLRTLTKQFAKLPMEEQEQFFGSLPHYYYEENILHGLLLCEQRDYDQTLRLLGDYLPYVGSWAECDTLSPRSFKLKKNRPRLLSDIPVWISSPLPFVKRFGMQILMNHFLDDDFHPEQLQWVAAERMDHYYVRMGAAWYFATALAKQWDATLPVIESCTLDPWIHNKSIQKAIESYRVSDEHKAILRSLRIKK